MGRVVEEEAGGVFGGGMWAVAVVGDAVAVAVAVAGEGEGAVARRGRVAERWGGRWGGTTEAVGRGMKRRTRVVWTREKHELGIQYMKTPAGNSA